MTRTVPARLFLLSCLFAALALPARADKPVPERKDRDGDPLPTGAVARLGSKRYRLPPHLPSARLSPDGKLVAVGGGGGFPQVVLLDVKTGKEVRRLRTTAAANFLLFDPTGKTIASTWYDGFIRFWDATTGAQVRQVSTGTVRANTFTLSGDGKVLALAPSLFGKKGTAYVYDTETGKERCHVEVEQMNSIQTALGGDGKLLATWGGTWFTGRATDREKEERIARTVQLWDTTTGKEARRVLSEHGPILGTALSPDGKTVVLATQAFAIQFHDAGTGKLLRTVQARHNVGATLVFSPDGKVLLATSYTGKLQGWDVRTGNRLPLRAGPPCNITSFAFPGDGRILACGLEGQTLVVWDARSGKVYGKEGGHRNQVGALAFTADGKHLLTAGIDSVVLRWDVGTGKRAGAVEDDRDDNSVFMMRRNLRESLLLFSPDGKHLVAAGSGAPGYRLRELTTGQELFTFAVGSGFSAQGGVAFAPDGSLVAGAGMDWKRKKWEVHFWKVATGEELSALKGIDGQVVALAVAPGGKHVAVGTQPAAFGVGVGNQFELRLWGRETGKSVKSFQQFNATGFGNRSLSFSPDGRWLAVGNFTGTVSLLDAQTGVEAHALPAAGSLTTPLVFSPDGRTLVAGVRRGAADETVVRVWEIVSGKVRRDLPPVPGNLSALAFSPDGTRLASACGDTTVLVWDMTGRLSAGAPAKDKLDDKFLGRLWADLGAGAPEGFEAIAKLTAAPEEAVPLLAKKVRPVPRKSVDEKALDKLIVQLDDDEFTVREEAQKQLTDLGRAALPALRKALAARPSAEAKRRLDQLLEKANKPGAAADLVRPVRAVEALERIGTPQARKVLQDLAKGDPSAEVTQQASAALRRLMAHGTPEP